jgi:hypothetical protein
MNDTNLLHCTAFAGDSRIASGKLKAVAAKVKALLEADPQAAPMIFNDASGETIEVDFRGNADDMLDRLAAREDRGAAPAPAPAPETRGPGRPKLGVVAREVTLLPRHWDWLGAQPGGASVALRKLVEEAKRSSSGADLARQAQGASYRFMSTMAGNRPGFEDATRALFAGQRERFEELIAVWPSDIRSYAHKLAEPSFQPASGREDKE